MDNRFIYASPSADHRPATPQSDSEISSEAILKTAHGNGISSEDLQSLFQQLAQALTVLSGTAELVSNGKVDDAHNQALFVWLHPNARQAEMAMHQLRDLLSIKSQSLTELSQSLTVLVLAADMLSHGQLSGSDAFAFYDLLRRNADAAIACLAELRDQVLL